MSTTIKYSEISNEDIKEVWFNVDGVMETFIIHEFTQNDKMDYIVIGKLKDNNQDMLRGADYLSWIVSVNKGIQNYKEPSKSNNYEFFKILESLVTKSMSFTLEGYDLLTNKFKYTDDEINRTVNFITVQRSNKLLYTLPNDITVMLKEKFYDLVFLDENFVFTEQEISKLEKSKFLEYIQKNLGKVNNIIKKDPNFSNYMKSLVNTQEKIDHLMQYIATGSINDFEKTKKRVKSL